MPAFNAAVSGVTPTAGQSDIGLEAATAGYIGYVIGFGWGGQDTSSTAMESRWVRPTADGTTPTALVDEPSNPQFPTALCSAYSTWATDPTFPTSPQDLHAQSWNSHGGSGYIALPQRAPWVIFNDGGLFDARMMITHVAEAGTGVSSYSLTWEE